MDVKEYRSNLHEDVAIASASNMTNPDDEFLAVVTDILISGEEFDEFISCYYEGVSMGNGHGSVRVDGYAMDEVDGSCCLFISEYRGPNGQESLDKKQCSYLFDSLIRFIKECFKEDFYKGLEESDTAYEFARRLYNSYKEITKFRLYLLTDAYYKSKTPITKAETIDGKEIELNVWDIKRIFNVGSSAAQKESIEIRLSDFSSSGIPCVRGTECVNATSDVEIPLSYDGLKQSEDKTYRITYSSYLTVIPGSILCSMYLEYGSRLLEGNVRSFLSAKGKVNKSIQNTIKNCPEMFFAYNNGIAATATEVETEQTQSGLVITRIKDLQIVNGGQTTASIANVVLTARKDETVELDKIMVPMKISVLEHSMSEIIIPKISEYSNSQNKVDASDFFSNHPFHKRMEEYSMKTAAPAVNDNQYRQYWFYERLRGQYNQGKMKLSLAELKQYKLKYPEKQVIKMFELAKYVEIYEGAPDKVSKGKQAIVKEFAEQIKTQWNKSDEQFNVAYFKRVVALAIMYKKADLIIKNSEEYTSGRKNSYKANVVAYTLSIIFEYIRQNRRDKAFDFARIWDSQNTYPELEKQITVLWPEVYDYITDNNRLTQNVTEWCKRRECWEWAKTRRWKILPEFLDTLVEFESLKKEESYAKAVQKTRNYAKEFRKVWGKGREYWEDVLDWGNKRKLLQAPEQDVLKLCIDMYSSDHAPNEWQIKMIIKIREKLIDEGMPIDI